MVNRGIKRRDFVKSCVVGILTTCLHIFRGYRGCYYNRTLSQDRVNIEHNKTITRDEGGKRINLGHIRVYNGVGFIRTFAGDVSMGTDWFAPEYRRRNGSIFYPSFEMEVNNCGIEISPEMFGAKGGDVDDTIAIQAALDFAIENNCWLDGSAKSYLVNGIRIMSNTKIKNITLCHSANADMNSTLYTISNDYCKYIVLFNVHIVGNRTSQTGVESSSNQEDGGRHCLAIRGPVEYLYIEQCSFSHSAGDGMLMFQENQSLSFPFRNIICIRSTFYGNRRHGISANSVDGLFFIQCCISSNGLDCANDLPSASGGMGDRFNGMLYGNGIDLEEYDDIRGSNNVLFLQCSIRQNARSGILILTTKNSMSQSLFGNYHFIGCEIDKGMFSTTGASVEITPNTNLVDDKVFHEIYAFRCDLCDGDISIRSGWAVVHDVKSSARYAVKALENAIVVTDNRYFYRAKGSEVKLCNLTAA